MYYRICKFVIILECIHKIIPDVIDKDKWTPLHFACDGGHKEIAEYLVEKLKCNAGKFDNIIIIFDFDRKFNNAVTDTFIP